MEVVTNSSNGLASGEKVEGRDEGNGSRSFRGSKKVFCLFLVFTTRLILRMPHFFSFSIYLSFAYRVDLFL